VSGELPDLVVKIKADLRQLLADLAKAEVAVDAFGEKVSHSGDKVKDSIKPASKEAENFDRLVTKAGKDGETAFNTVRRRIDETKASIVDLRRQVQAGGGGSLFGDLKKAEQDLKKLESIGKDLGLDIVKSMEKVGTKSGASFVNAFSASVADLAEGAGPIGGWVIAGLIAAATLAAPVLIGILGAAVSTAFGGIFVAAGILAVAHDPAVQQAFKALTSSLGAVFKDAASSFVQPVRAAVGEIITEFQTLAPELRGVFGEAAKLVQPLTRALLGLVANLLPGFRSALADLAPVFQTLAVQLPKVGTAIGNFFDKITADGPQVSFALTALINVIINLINWIGSIIQVSEDLLYTLAGWGSALNDAAGSVLHFTDTVLQLGGLLDGLSGWFHRNSDSLDGMKRASDNATGATNQTALAGALLAQQLERLTTDIHANVDAINQWTDAQYAADNANLALHQAMSGFQQALKENKHNWDLNTKSGQALYGAFLQQAGAIQRYYEQLEQADPANESLVKAQLKSEKALLAQAKAAGATDDEVATLRSSIKKLQDQLDKLHNKTVTLTVHTKYYYSGGGAGQHAAVAQGGVRYAQGGIDYAGIRAGSGAYGTAKAFADSGVYSGGGQNSLVKFAEPSTGGEAYISRNGDRNRQMSALMTALGWMAERSPGSMSAMTINNSYSNSTAGDIVVTVNSILDGQKIARSQVKINQRQLQRTGTTGQA